MNVILGDAICWFRYAHSMLQNTSRKGIGKQRQYSVDAY